MLSSFFMPSLDMESFDILSLDMVSFFMLSLDIVSFFIPSSLPILSWAKAAPAKARPSESMAAEIPVAMRVRMVMIGHPSKNGLEGDWCRLAFGRRRDRLCYH